MVDWACTPSLLLYSLPYLPPGEPAPFWNSSSRGCRCSFLYHSLSRWQPITLKDNTLANEETSMLKLRAPTSPFSPSTTGPPVLLCPTRTHVTAHLNLALLARRYFEDSDHRPSTPANLATRISASLACHLRFSPTGARRLEDFSQASPAVKDPRSRTRHDLISLQETPLLNRTRTYTRKARLQSQIGPCCARQIHDFDQNLSCAINHDNTGAIIHEDHAHHEALHTSLSSLCVVLSSHGFWRRSLPKG